MVAVDESIELVLHLFVLSVELDERALCFVIFSLNAFEVHIFQVADLIEALTGYFILDQGEERMLRGPVSVDHFFEFQIFLVVHEIRARSLGCA